MSIVLSLLLLLLLVLVAFKLLALPLEERDVWLKAISAILLGLTTVVGVWALITGHFVNQRLEERLEKERATRLELEQTIAPRMLSPEEIGKMGAALRKYGRTKVKIVALTDGEVMRTARDIVGIANAAGWEIVAFDRTTEVFGFRDGITVHARHSYDPEDTGTSRAAGIALVGQLLEHKIECIFNPERIEQPVNTVVVMVGFKPPTYFLPAEMKARLKQMEERLKRFAEEEEERRRERQKERDRQYLERERQKNFGNSQQ